MVYSQDSLWLAWITDLCGLKDTGDMAAWKTEDALGLIQKDNGIQAVYGPKADVLKSDINDIL